MGMPAVSHDSPKYVLCANVRIERANDDGWYDNEGKSGFLLPGFLQTSHEWRCGVLTVVMISNNSSSDKDDNLGKSQDSKGLWEILGLLHLSNEGRIENPAV